MGLPKIKITFETLARTAVVRGQRGVVALLLRETASRMITMHDATEIPEDLTGENLAYVKRAWMGYVNPPIRVEAVVMGEGDTVADALEKLENIRFDYLALPPDATAQEAEDAAEWIALQRDTVGKKCKAVLPNTDADHEGVINFAAAGMADGEKTYTAAEYCSRIAGILAGTPLDISCTYAPLPELNRVDAMRRSEADDAIDAGKLILIHDGVRVKIARGVNSLTTLTNTKGAEFTKIKLVDVMDLIGDDIHRTLSDTFIGKFANTYDNKCLIISMILAYFEGLEGDGILVRGGNSVDIDTAAVKDYLREQGVDVSGITDKQLREANTGDKLFLVATIRLVDAIEEVYLPITIGRGV